MTITAEDRTQVGREISPFGAQDSLGEDLPNVIKNLFREYASRSDVPDELELSEHTIGNVCDQLDIGSLTLQIDSRLSAEISDFPFEAKYEVGLNIDDLREIVADPNCSYPAVSLSQQRYHPTGYEVQTDKYGNARKLRTLVMRVNHNKVLQYDPHQYGSVDNINRIEPTEVPKQSFTDAWEGRFESTETLWIESTEQTRISGFST